MDIADAWSIEWCQTSGQDESILAVDDLLQKTIERGGEVHWQFTDANKKEYLLEIMMTNPHLFSYGRGSPGVYGQ